jgi:hypothetical protein
MMDPQQTFGRIRRFVLAAVEAGRDSLAPECFLVEPGVFSGMT